MKKLVLVMGLLLLTGAQQSLAADSVDIPEEELARESVLPRFDRPDNVKNRNVVTEKKVEFGAYVGSNFTEPIYNQMKFGFNLGYHWSEDASIMVNFAKWMDGRNSQYVPGIEQKGNLDFSRAPNLEYSMWGNYELKTYYGKISLTKQGVMNLSVYPIMGVGVTKYTHKMYPGVNGGIGQKFYFGKSLALRIDFKLQYQQGPSPFLKGGLAKSQAAPDAGDFEDKFRLDNVMDIGLSYLF
ncbi:MAG: outer membrane beta-barrel domain-containing protein [Bdellovibrio sp.]